MHPLLLLDNMVETHSVSICGQEFLLSRYSSGLYHLQDQLWEKGENVKTGRFFENELMPFSMRPHQCGYRTLGNLFQCFLYSWCALLQFFLSEPPEVRKFCPFQRLFFQLVKASGLTRNQNGMLHYVRTACLVCLLRNNQEKLYVKRHRCSFLRNSFILLKYKMKKSSWSLEQYVFCIPI